MSSPSKNGRRKKLWDVAATVGALDRHLGDEPDPESSDPRRSFLHFARTVCRELQANLPAIQAFDRLLRLMHDQAGPIRRYARDVIDAFQTYRPLTPKLEVLLEHGASDQLWKLWFFACQMPERLHRVMVDVDRLLYAGIALMPAPLNAPGFQLIATRAAILLGLKAHDFSIPEIAALMDPRGVESNRNGTQARIRQEVSRIQKASVRAGDLLDDKGDPSAH